MAFPPVVNPPARLGAALALPAGLVLVFLDERVFVGRSFASARGASDGMRPSPSWLGARTAGLRYF